MICVCSFVCVCCAFRCYLCLRVLCLSFYLLRFDVAFYMCGFVCVGMSVFLLRSLCFVCFVFLCLIVVVCCLLKDVSVLCLWCS